MEDAGRETISMLRRSSLTENEIPFDLDPQKKNQKTKNNHAHHPINACLDLAHPPDGLFYPSSTSATSEQRICRATEELSRVLSLIEAEEEGEEEKKHEDDNEGFVDVAAEKKAQAKGSPSSARRRRRETTRLDLGGGEGDASSTAAGFAAELCERCHVVSRDGVHVLFARAPSSSSEATAEGEQEDAVGPFEWPGFLAAPAAEAHAAEHEEQIGEEKEATAAAAAAAAAEAASLVAEALADAAATATNPAEAALAFYQEFAARLPLEAEERARVALSQAKGGFSFVVFDASQGRLFAARDALGLAPLSWGVKDGLLMFASDPADLAACEPSSVEFGPGTLFVSGATEPASP